MAALRLIFSPMAIALAVGTIALQLASAWHTHDAFMQATPHYAPIEQEHCILCHVPTVLLPGLSEGGGDVLPCYSIEEVDYLSVPALQTPERHLQPRAPPAT